MVGGPPHGRRRAGWTRGAAAEPVRLQTKDFHETAASSGSRGNSAGASVPLRTPPSEQALRASRRLHVCVMAALCTARCWLLLAMALVSRAKEEGHLDSAPAESSSLAKFVLTLSRPGAFNKTHPVFEDEAEQAVTSCPPGEDGLACRRAEARRLADCPSGDCEVCRSCDKQHSAEWPKCCQHNSMCCYQLAAACQECNQHDLTNFCNKHFKRCFLN
ncbi:uncharacterized protein LOC134533405 [Bacillus rossius redtenbacheri]|uniref:uncharacterized protein LOC134533405 n=1 Tax=Bacillus rossius redtenbacheri TaxID=93214 RepID=UPI002FDED0A9